MVAAGAVPRLLLAKDALPEVLRQFTWSDVLFTWVRGLSGGRLPYFDTYFEYPPFAGYLSGLFSVLAPSALIYVAVWAAVQAASAALIVVVLVRSGAGRRAWAWALAPELALLGPVNFDLLAALALVLAVHAERVRAPLRATAWLAVGTLTKLFPAAALPVVLVRGSSGARRNAVTRTLLFGAIVAIGFAPAAAAPFSSLESLRKYTTGMVANFDSFWGIAASLLKGIGIDPATPLALVTAVGLAATFLVGVLPAARAARDPAAPVALAIVTVLLWSRVYSPQYSLWVVPFFALVPIRAAPFALLVAADLLVFFTVYPLSLTRHAGDDLLGAALVVALAVGVALRHVGLVWWWIEMRRAAHA